MSVCVCVCVCVCVLFEGARTQTVRPLQLVVIDEAHCMSSWAANFRPALLRLERVLKETLPVRSILALTATATPRVMSQVHTHTHTQ